MVYRRMKRFGRKALKAPFKAARWGIRNAGNANSAYAIAMTAYKNTRYLRGLVNSEMFHTIQTGTTNVSNTGSIFHITQLAIGDGDNQRTGNSVLVRTLLFRASVTQNQVAPSCTYRMMLVWDTQQAPDATPSINDVLSTLNPLSALSTNTSGRFKVLMSKIFNTSPQNPTRTVEKYFNLYKHVRFNGPATSDIQKNGLYLLLLSDRSTELPTVGWYTKLGYRDN